ncbi:MAG: bifunctional diaminohydroxyphosphoribosylaminopyrimidine deaminase/5-amino-6-(5-phosphoribosylamino)uracil reductase RibD [Elusimicrobia bacterium]|nr:bifunctional diaminohydroxyphosphoribosylaminopyrimidine deaminase/5-amino-6-(5-phosphoribosylamino)uracil reductase RibD [Candidatus Liberimonas magnetica]
MEKQALDKKYMKIAFALAKRGASRVHPNPMVGCVLVKDNKIIGRGYHEYFGGPHAEINALKQAGRNASGSTLYVTLEPCTHWAKTPPCAESIVKAGVKRVVTSIEDPNPEVFGKGIKYLSKKGIKVTTGVLSQQSMLQNERYLTGLKYNRSRVVLKMAMSVDGKIAARTGDSKWISGPESRAFVHKLRSKMDGILVGVNTVLKDNPELSSHGFGSNPVRIIIDPELKTPLNYKVVDGNISTIIIYSSNKVKAKLEALAKRPGVIPVKMPSVKGYINFKNILKLLMKYGIYNVLLEGGGETAAKALEDGIVDEIILAVSPKIIGGRDAKTPIEGTGVAKVSKAINLKTFHVSKLGKDFILRGRI